MIAAGNQQILQNTSHYDDEAAKSLKKRLFKKKGNFLDQIKDAARLIDITLMRSRHASSLATSEMKSVSDNQQNLCSDPKKENSREKKKTFTKKKSSQRDLDYPVIPPMLPKPMKQTKEGKEHTDHSLLDDEHFRNLLRRFDQVDREITQQMFETKTVDNRLVTDESKETFNSPIYRTAEANLLKKVSKEKEKKASRSKSKLGAIRTVNKSLNKTEKFKNKEKKLVPLPSSDKESRQKKLEKLLEIELEEDQKRKPTSRSKSKTQNTGRLYKSGVHGERNPSKNANSRSRSNLHSQSKKTLFSTSSVLKTQFTDTEYNPVANLAKRNAGRRNKSAAENVATGRQGGRSRKALDNAIAEEERERLKEIESRIPPKSALPEEEFHNPSDALSSFYLHFNSVNLSNVVVRPNLQIVIPVSPLMIHSESLGSSSFQAAGSLSNVKHSRASREDLRVSRSGSKKAAKTNGSAKKTSTQPKIPKGLLSNLHGAGTSLGLLSVKSTQMKLSAFNESRDNISDINSLKQSSGFKSSQKDILTKIPKSDKNKIKNLDLVESCDRRIQALGDSLFPKTLFSRQQKTSKATYNRREKIKSGIEFFAEGREEPPEPGYGDQTDLEEQDDQERHLNPEFLEAQKSIIERYKGSNLFAKTLEQKFNPVPSSSTKQEDGSSLNRPSSEEVSATPRLGESGDTGTHYSHQVHYNIIESHQSLEIREVEEEEDQSNFMHSPEQSHERESEDEEFQQEEQEEDESHESNHLELVEEGRKEDIFEKLRGNENLKMERVNEYDLMNYEAKTKAKKQLTIEEEDSYLSTPLFQNSVIKNSSPNFKVKEESHLYISEYVIHSNDPIPHSGFRAIPSNLEPSVSDQRGLKNGPVFTSFGCREESREMQGEAEEEIKEEDIDPLLQLKKKAFSEGEERPTSVDYTHAQSEGKLGDSFEFGLLSSSEQMSTYLAEALENLKLLVDFVMERIEEL